MIERLDVPAGVIGFRVSGEVSRRDYEDVLIPPLREAIERGEELRCLVQVGPGFQGYQAGAVWEDVKTGFRYGIGHHKAWRRLAIVTDVEWIARAVALFGWMGPGEMRLFDPDDLDEAKAWVSAP